MLDISLRLLVLVAAIVQIVFPYIVNPFADGAQPVRASDLSMIEPARYAFAIWGPIYLGAVAYAVWQLTPAGRRTPATARIAPLALAVYAGSTAWLSAVEYGPLWATMPILAVMAAAAIACLVLAVAGKQGSLAEEFVLVVPFGLYAGWTVAAIFVNVAEVAPGYGFDRFGLSAGSYAVGSIGVLTGIVLATLWATRGNLTFAATVAWALAAIIVAAFERGYDGAVPVAAGAALGVVALATLVIRSRSGGAPRARAPGNLPT
ncbi:MAG: hypothetical protein NW205_10035 [Hyphomicrobiaceae bacterium]|nr:hypothetical protein [Hyphomicrobiaceae bacterium]